ncbi:precorrin-2 C20-methyltransferase [Paludibacter propionicigenes WB4]|uniref:Precorrin-2 C20-methyltransferase n=1 Tax=Paludibacter propionicigenes (strain DSM 17365 / JCM 13257 / WB4) TaxID=694427 RepID=E4T7K7_PALPW|nr:precorrin-2 C(20)-methyltransferase [Paludibacter propionicigenes]ADQ80701.1 precorrin-2 C20-methyltransferase [Paludibacter propionicigenes WB4]
MKGKFYGIGVGPGDPELLTLKAVRVLANIDVLAVPESKREAGSVAHDIARPYLKAGVEVLTLTFPMIRDAEAKAKIRRDNALRIIEKIDAGLNVAFLTLGDPMLYSTYIYLLDNMKDQGIDIVSIPGIYSFSAISNLLNEPLVKGDESMAVISEFNPEVWEKLQSVQTIVCMKVSAYGGQLFDALQRQSYRKMVMVTNAGKETQTVSYNQEDLKGDIPYFTTVIVSKTE